MRTPQNKEPIALGIDPGLSGALVLVSPSRVLHVVDLDAYRVPKREPGKLPNKRAAQPSSYPPSPLACPLDPNRLLQAILTYFLGPNRPVVVAIEDVSVQSPGVSPQSMFRFGQVKGLLTGLVYGAGTHSPSSIPLAEPVVWLRPSVWKLAMGLDRDKSKSINLAINLWPNQAELFRLKKHADRAEAALIGLSGLRAVGLCDG